MDAIKGGEANNVTDGGSKQNDKRKGDKTTGMGKDSVHHNTRAKVLNTKEDER